MSTLIATRRFVAADQEAFAVVSGDRNPMHMDPLSARRTQAGGTVVHGMHAVLWALDALLRRAPGTEIAAVSAEFRAFLSVGAEVELRLLRETDGELRAALIANGLTTARLTIGRSAASRDPLVLERPPALPRIGIPAKPLVHDLAGAAGFEALLTDGSPPSARALFPVLAERIGQPALASLVRLSTVVGMVCPGLHSIFSGFAVQLSAARAGEGMHVRVREADERFRRLTIDVVDGPLSGTIEAFLRHPPVQPPAVAELAGVVAGDEFRGMTALIVGGSRGLGALTARIIAAGGGRAVITYVAGEDEARELVREVGPERARALRYDACADAEPQLAALPWPVDALYYFATVPIFRAKSGWWVPERFAEFCEVYVDGFVRTCAAVYAHRAGALAVFYPSSVAVDERPRDMAEYSAAKAAGERVCADVARALDARVIVRRLPRVVTDQTATVVPVESSDALAVMLPLVREMASPPR